MKLPTFENCQVALDGKGKIIKASESFSSWLGLSSTEIIGKKFLALIFSLEENWKPLLSREFYRKDFEQFLPLTENSEDSSVGIQMNVCNYETMSVISLSPALAPHDSLKKAFMGDLMKDPRALANTLIRLQKAEPF